MNKNKKTSFVFFGSGPVASKSLSLLTEHFDIEAIITKPSTEQEMSAASPDTPVFCVSSKAELDKLCTERAFKSTLGVLIDFGIIVSKNVIQSFKKGIVNSHFSLLPQWRGADPITFSILSGQEQTGVSLMLLVEKMDEGPLISVGVYDFKGDETTPELTSYLVQLSSTLLCDNLTRYAEGDTKPMPQIDFARSLGYDTTPTYSRKLTKEDGRLDWTKDAIQLEREVRAYAGWPKSFTKLGSIELTVTKCHVVEPDTIQNPSGKYAIWDKELHIQCGHGILSLDIVKPAGKKEMPIQAFLAGYAQKLSA